MLLALPRLWVPPFVVISADVFAGDPAAKNLSSLGSSFLSRVRNLSSENGQIIVRSSVLGESIWDRGSYESKICNVGSDGFQEVLQHALEMVLRSAHGNQMGLVVQRFIQPRLYGEFGNLLRVSKTRDHWELSSTTSGIIKTNRFNTQRDESASPHEPLKIKSSHSRERQFGSIAAWLNNYLLRGRHERLNSEWVSDHEHLFLVQIDEEDEDHVGINPFQLNISPSYRPKAAKGAFLRHAEGDAITEWDKLKVLDELWEPSASHKPVLFFVPLQDLIDSEANDIEQLLVADFRSLVGSSNIVVRTSVRAGKEKIPNLPRTEGLSPEKAASWAVKNLREFVASNMDLGGVSFVTHRFVPARASAWVRAEPDNPVVEINSLWGLPDALQYCPYDIWEVHVPTETATDYPEYKSNMLIARDDGKWEYVRIKNELARSLSVGHREALDIARRTQQIAINLREPCHVMWFVDCVDEDGTRFHIPWYWTPAHSTERNPDRANYQIVEVSDHASLAAFVNSSAPRLRQAVRLQPKLELIRDNGFIIAVGEAAKAVNVPVILQGSTLAHAYYQLRRQGCTVVTPGEKEHSRVRRSASFGKLVRDNIPARIAARYEAEATWKLPGEIVKGFLIGKLIEEATEVRSAETSTEKAAELADLYEVVLALVGSEDIPMDEVIKVAEEKKRKAGGFNSGTVLLQTGIYGRDRASTRAADRRSQVLARRISNDSYEIPFSFFGFMESGLTRSLVFDALNARLDVTLKTDRIVLQISRNAEQLEFPLDRTVGPAEAE